MKVDDLQAKVDALVKEVTTLKQQLQTLQNSRKITFKRANEVLKENITYHQVVAQECFKIPNLTPNTVAVLIKVFFLYNGPGRTHGYINGKFSQIGHENDPEYVVPFNHYHYNWYYNSETVEYIVPWDTNRDGYLIVDFKDTFNTNVENKYKIVYSGSVEN